MGLLSHISGNEALKAGLLARSTQLAEKPAASSFPDLCKTYHFSHGAVLSLADGSFVMTHCFGIDAATAALSVSSPDFWNGTIGTGSAFVNMKKGDKLFSSFYQLISEDARAGAEGFHFFRLSPSLIFFSPDIGSYEEPSCIPAEFKAAALRFLSSPAAKASLPDISAGFASCKAFCLLLSVKIAVSSAESAVQSSSAPISGAAFDAVYSEICELLFPRFAPPSCAVKSQNGEIKILFFASETFDESLLQFHLMRTLKPILGDYADSIILLKAGMASDSSEALHFLTEG